MPSQRWQGRQSSTSNIQISWYTQQENNLILKKNPIQTFHQHTLKVHIYNKILIKSLNIYSRQLIAHNFSFCKKVLYSRQWAKDYTRKKHHVVFIRPMDCRLQKKVEVSSNFAHSQKWTNSVIIQHRQKDFNLYTKIIRKTIEDIEFWKKKRENAKMGLTWYLAKHICIHLRVCKD